MCMLARNTLNDVLIPLDDPSRVILGERVHGLKSSRVRRMFHPEGLVVLAS